MQKITKNNLDWILFIKYCFINECDNAKKVARDALFSKQNSYLKNILFIPQINDNIGHIINNMPNEIKLLLNGNLRFNNITNNAKLSCMAVFFCNE